jgi:RNA recognition motif-containing protein
MARGSYSLGKRQREAEKARKKQEKAEKRQQRRERGPGEMELATAEEMSGQLRSVEEVLRDLEQRRSAPQAAAPIPSRLFVGGLNWETTSEDLRAAFGAFGVVTDAVIVTERATGNSKGFGFVTMENRKDGVRAIEGLHDSELGGRRIVVNAATERSR